MCNRAPVGKGRGGPPEHSSVRAVGRDGRAGRVRGSRRAQVRRGLVWRDVVLHGRHTAGVHRRVRCDHVRLEKSFWNVKDFAIMTFPFTFCWCVSIICTFIYY